MPIIAVNKYAKFSYDLLENFEAGIVLSGQETKSVKMGQINLKGSYVSVKNGEIYLINAHISPYKHAGKLPDYDPVSPRKLLLRKKEIRYLIGKIQEKGLTLVPIKVYTEHNRVKLEIALAKGKKLIDKRETIKKREQDRNIRRMLKE